MLPQSVKSVLWSYDTNIIDIVADRKLIVSQVLNFGSKEATDWAMSNYGKMGIREVALSILGADGTKNLWLFGHWY